MNLGAFFASITPVDVWQSEAACWGADPDLFWEMPGRDAALYGRRVARAKTYCARCPVTAECLSIGKRAEEGIWGGMTPQERQKLYGKVTW